MPAITTRVARRGAAALLIRDPPSGRAAFESPIEFLAAEHERQLAVCAVLERAVHNPRHGASRAELEAVCDYLSSDLPRHLADEEDDLFPLLRRRCPPQDNIQEIFTLLREEHRADNALRDTLCEDLEVLIRGEAFSDPARFLVNAFAFIETQRRHLAWENAVVLPRARRYLSEADCAELSRRMAARRGVSLAD